MKTKHPRLLVTAATWAGLKDRRQHDPLLHQFLRQSEAEARALLTIPPVVYEKKGKRLATISRRVLQRVLLLSFNFRLTGEAVFARRAESEMLAAAAFADWNPEHFLDTAEMTAALALGYDWLFDELSPTVRTTLREAIVEKGLKPGLDPQLSHRSWQDVTTNWNPVCIGGLTLGALAVAEDEPALTEQMLAVVKSKNPNGLAAYAPEGVYPEGPSYWNYGTCYQVLLLAALESALGTDFGLGKSPGFMESAAAYVQTTSPTGQAFNFFDGSEYLEIAPPLFWFAGKLNQPDLVQTQRTEVERYCRRQDWKRRESNRFMPLVALWWGNNTQLPPNRQPLHWLGQGENPLAIFRSSWGDTQAMYLGIKGGSASLNHGHMDAGSFVFEADGVRWAKDLGKQDYNSLESKNIDLWNNAQNSDRWKVFRINNFSHNTLTIGGQLHQVKGHAEITRFFDEKDKAGAVVDLTPVFAPQVKKAMRGFLFRPDGHVLIVDELEGVNPGTVVRWTMATGAEITIENSKAMLQQDRKHLSVSLVTPDEAKFEIASADYTADGFNAPNPGIQLLVANIKVPASGRIRIEVLLQMGSLPLQTEKWAKVPLAQWQ